MNITIIGGTGFIGVNLVKALAADSNNKVRVIGRTKNEFKQIESFGYGNVSCICGDFELNSDFDSQINGQDVLFHLVSTIIPSNSNEHIPEELESNVIVTAKLLDACVRQRIKKVVFISSGGTVYGKKKTLPLVEDTVTYPITSYGIQKLAIEKLLYLYWYQFGLDYRIIRLANPYGPFQQPNGKLGVVTTFVYRALTHGKLEVYGDGSVIRDFIYIDDAIRGIINITNGENECRLFNLGSGYGTSVNEVIDTIKRIINPKLKVTHIATRATDIPVNYLDISRYEEAYGKLNPVSLETGILKTADFLKSQYNICEREEL